MTRKDKVVIQEMVEILLDTEFEDYKKYYLDVSIPWALLLLINAFYIQMHTHVHGLEEQKNADYEKLLGRVDSLMCRVAELEDRTERRMPIITGTCSECKNIYSELAVGVMNASTPAGPQCWKCYWNRTALHDGDGALIYWGDPMLCGIPDAIK